MVFGTTKAWMFSSLILILIPLSSDLWSTQYEVNHYSLTYKLLWQSNQDVVLVLSRLVTAICKELTASCARLHLHLRCSMRLPMLLPSFAPITFPTKQSYSSSSKVDFKKASWCNRLARHHSVLALSSYILVLLCRVPSRQWFSAWAFSECWWRSGFEFQWFHYFFENSIEVFVVVAAGYNKILGTGKCLCMTRESKLLLEAAKTNISLY